MKYRIYFEPEDIEVTRKEDIDYKIFSPPISRILPIDKDGFPIKL